MNPTRRTVSSLLSWLSILAAVVAVLGQPGADWASAGEPGDPQAGREVFQDSCAMCHGADASGMMGMHPSLRGAVQRLSLEGVYVTIRKGRATTPPMPAFEGRLSEQQIDDVVAYVASLPPGPRNFGPRTSRGDRERGEGMMDDGMMPGRMMGDRTWFVAALLLLVLLAVAVAGLVWLIRSLRSGAGSATARQVLDERYAAGELSREEYLQRRRDLEIGPK